VPEAMATELQSVVFRLGEEEYGIDIGKVQEIIRLPEITKLPNTADYVLGIINLRGRIIPIIDLKRKFLQETSHRKEETRVIVLETGSQKVGIIVDEVSEVVKIPLDLVVAADSIGTSIEAEYLLGVAKFNERLLILPDTDKIFR
jgi:purine-binding chemotaxis protein CheW